MRRNLTVLRICLEKKSFTIPQTSFEKKGQNSCTLESEPANFLYLRNYFV